MDLIWSEVDAPWHDAFGLAWEAFVAGSPPVGAVVVAPDGTVVARGRSRRAEASSPANQLAGSRIAHAEVNALAQLRPDQHDGYRLYTTLEPCFLCTAATAVAHIREVHFAGEDPKWHFTNDLHEFHPTLRDRWFRTYGPLEGPLGELAILLPLIDRVDRHPDGYGMEVYRAARPDLVDLATELVTQRRDRALRQLPLDEGISALLTLVKD